MPFNSITFDTQEGLHLAPCFTVRHSSLTVSFTFQFTVQFHPPFLTCPSLDMLELYQLNHHSCIESCAPPSLPPFRQQEPR
ncbi:hypothetical protein E2C01_057471 [Portunus trituberculatus]|uniref:Uncharacterized protein n=1 Tax=Portunus trituberculatus TaxID=210409 RepID=A0A5B7H033_PORTR|nr:hypothetical protein [Portunus trituberculatus]